MNILNLLTNESNETNSQAIADTLNTFKIFIMVSLVVFVFILSILLTCYTFKRNCTCLGLFFSFIIGIVGFMGLFLAKEKEERKEFFFGWALGYTIRLFYFIGIVVALLLT